MLRRVLIAILVAHGVAIYAFVRGFLLTRIHLPKTEYTGFDGDLCSSPYKKLVWIVVDALRYVYLNNSTKSLVVVFVPKGSW